MQDEQFFTMILQSKLNIFRLASSCCDGNTKSGECSSYFARYPTITIVFLLHNNPMNRLFFVWFAVKQSHFYTGQPATDLFVACLYSVLCFMVASLIERTGGNR